MKLPSFKKGLHVAVMALMVFYFSGFMPIISIPTAQATPPSGTRVNWVQVNDQGAVHVAPGTEITVTVNVTTAGSGSSDNWESTKYKIEGGNWTCVNIPNPNINGDGTYTRSFKINAPSTKGKYDLEVKAYQDDNCNGGNDSKILPNAIFVEIPDTIIEAQKVICDAEEYLPNGLDVAEITNTTAQDYVDNSEGHCWLAKNWDFEWWTSDTQNTTFSVKKAAVIPTDEGTVKVKEVLPNEYIPFSNSKNDYTAEFYCGDDVTNYDNEEWLKDIKAGETYQCVGFNALKPFCGDGQVNQESEQCDDGKNNGNIPEVGYGEQTNYCSNACTTETVVGDYCGDEKVNGTEQCDEGPDGGATCTAQCTLKPAVIDAYKIICPAETNLPDWGVNDNIKPASTPSSITDWVESGDIYSWVEENGCELARDWGFEWAYDPAGNPEEGDNDYNNTDADWSTFNVNSPVALTNLGNGTIWVREAVDPAYVPFSSTINPTEPQTSAEMYCDTDILNYDNYEWISGLKYGETYNCVAFNVLDQGTVTFEKDVRWNNPDKDISDNTSFGVKANDEYLGDVSENSPLTVELPTGAYNASEVLPDGYEMTNGGGEFTVETGSEQTIKFTNKTMCEPGEGWAYSVVEEGTHQGTKKNGQAITDPMRTNPMDAVGPASLLANGDDFFALGKGGSITLAFEGTVKDVDGVDLSFHEETWNNRKTYGEEKAEVFISYNGSDWFSIGEVRNESLSDDGTVDGIQYLDIAPAGLPVIKYVKLVDTTDYTQTSLPSDADGYDLDAVDVTYGYCKDVAPSYIQGKKFNDFNYDGAKNNGETFMNDWTINLYVYDDSSWNLVDSMKTGDDTTEAGNVAIGQYRFTNLYPDTYYICEVQQDGWYQTKSGNVENLSGNEAESPYCFKAVITDNGQKRTGRQFGNAELLNIHGFKWHDANANGIRDCALVPENSDLRSAYVDELPESPVCEEYSEELLPGWTIFIDENGNQQRDEGEQNMETDGSQEHFGWYWFDGLEAGTYNICEVVQAGWEQTYPNNQYETNCHQITVPNAGEGDTCWASSQLNAVSSNQECNFGNRTVGKPIIEKTVVVSGGEIEAAEINDTLTYTITVTNNYDSEIIDLLVEDTLPQHLTLVEGSFGGDYTPSNISGNTYQWGTFNLAGNSSVSMTFAATINDDITEDTTIENIAILYRQVAIEEEVQEVSFLRNILGIQTVHAASFELSYIAQANAVVDVTIPENPTIPETPEEPVVPETPGKVLGDETEAKLEVTKTASVEFTNPGETITYTVVVKNTGDAQALGVTVKDTLPEGFTFADSGDQSKTWFIGAVDMDGSKTLSYEVKVAANAVVGDYINTVLVSADNTDSVETTATVEVRVPKVLGDSVPETGTTPRDYAIFISSLMLIAAGIFLIRRGQSENIA